MTNKHLKAACAAVMICIALIAMAGASYDPEISEVRHLLEKRTDIISSVLSGNITFDEGKEQLKLIESEKIYTDDVDVLRSYQNTDYSEVLDMDIVSIEKKSHIYDRLSFACAIEWTIKDYDGMSKESITYTIGVSESEKKFKLISMEINEEN